VRVASVAAVIADAMRMATHMASSVVNVLVGLRRHQSYSTRVALMSAQMARDAYKGRVTFRRKLLDGLLAV
jgi:hypothetical protein